MPASSTFGSNEWNFRIFARRTILVKAKNENMRKAVAVDLLTDLPFSFFISENVSVESVEVEKQFSAEFKVYTTKNVGEVDSELVEFFQVLDVDQSFEDFVRVYWLYPSLIVFELTDVEPV
jgi:hypothetical protein